MSGAYLIMIVGLSIASMAFVFLFMILRNTEVTEERLRKIIGEEFIQKFKEAKSDEEIKEIIRSLPKKSKSKLKVLLESQDIRDAVAAIKKHILKRDNEAV